MQRQLASGCSTDAAASMDLVKQRSGCALSSGGLQGGHRQLLEMEPALGWLVQVPHIAVGPGAVFLTPDPLFPPGC